MKKSICIILASLFALPLLSQRKNAAILVFPGVQIIDYTGPYETFGQAGFNVFTVGADTNILVTSMQMKMAPAYSFINAPQADVLVIPGGAIPHQLEKEDPVVEWIRKQYEKSEWVLTVCNGTFVLGAGGYLDGKRATTNSGMVDHLHMAGNNITPVLDERFVRDGKIVTTGGLSAGIDGALFIISQMYSKARAAEIANQMEYDWDPARGYARGKLADMILSDIMDFNPPLRNKNMLVYEGNESWWKSEFIIKRMETPAEFYRQIIQMTKSVYPAVWTKKKEEIKDGAIRSEWRVTDMMKAHWGCRILVEPAPEAGLIHVQFDVVKE